MRLRPTLTVYGVGGLVGGGECEVGEDEAVDVDPLVDDFGDGLAGTVAGFGVDADEVGAGADVACLQGGGVFEGVRGDHAVVVVGGGH